jgi:hypothetical protein
MEALLLPSNRLPRLRHRAGLSADPHFIAVFLDCFRLRGLRLANPLWIDL